MSRRLLAVDLSNQVWRNLHANWALRNKAGTFTGGLFGFLTSIAAYVRDVKATDVVICRDMKPYVRSLEYPQYKALRAKLIDEDTRAAFEASMVQVLGVIDVLGLPVMAAPGFESDDCIARLVDQHRNRFELIVAASNDSDLHQLLVTPNFKVMGKGFAQAVDADILFANTGLTPEQFTITLALQGTHNDIEGIPGVGPVTAARAIRDPALMRRMREQHLDLINRNLRLIKLPHPDFPALGIPLRSRRFDARAFYRYLAPFDITATRTMLDAFESVSR